MIGTRKTNKAKMGAAVNTAPMRKMAAADPAYASVPLGVPEFDPNVAPAPVDVGRVDINPAARVPTGIFDRIKQFISSDDGRAALLRSGAATLQGGLGAGIEAGVGEIDRRKAAGIASRQYADKLALEKRGQEIDQQRVDQDGTYKENQALATMAGVNVDAQRAAETGRTNREKERTDRLELEEAIRKNRNGEQLTTRQIQVMEQNNIRSTNASIYGTDSARTTALGARAVAAAPQKQAVAISGGGKKPTLNVTATAANPMAPATQILPDGTKVVYDPMSGRWVPF